jgi:methylglutaconyl-CoA hydratase
MTEMTLAAPNGKIQIGPMIKVYAKVLANQVELDIDIAHFTEKLASYNPGFSPNEKIIWEGTDDWDTLLKSGGFRGISTV